MRSALPPFPMLGIACKKEVDKKKIDRSTDTQVSTFDKSQFDTHDPLLGDLFVAVQMQPIFADNKSFVVPGGRFIEVYSWDSSFTMLGLAESKVSLQGRLRRFCSVSI